MAKPQLKPVLKTTESQRLISQSRVYKIQKYGQYDFRVIRMNQDGSETVVSEPNVYPVVASNLIDLMLKDIDKHKEAKK
jgi:hypothetical protein